MVPPVLAAQSWMVSVTSSPYEVARTYPLALDSLLQCPCVAATPSPLVVHPLISRKICRQVIVIGPGVSSAV